MCFSKNYFLQIHIRWYFCNFSLMKFKHSKHIFIDLEKHVDTVKPLKPQTRITEDARGGFSLFTSSIYLCVFTSKWEISLNRKQIPC